MDKRPPRRERESLKKKKTSQNISLNLCVASAAQKKLPCGLRPSSKFASSSTSLASFHYFLIIWLSGLPIAWLVSGARHPDLFSSKWKITTTKKNPATFRLPATSPTGGTCATRIHFKSRDNCWPRIKITNKDRPMGCADLFGKVDGFCLSLWDVAVTACRSLVAVYVGRQISIRPRPITASVYKANNALQFSMAN